MQMSLQSTCPVACARTERFTQQPCRRVSMPQCFKAVHQSSAGSRRQQTRASCKSGNEAVAQTNRRALLLALVAAPGLAQLQPAHAEAPSLTTYKDKSDEFSLSVPANWVAGEGAAAGGKGYTGASGTRRALAWYPEGDLDTNLTIVITNVGADFTRLGSFGDAEQFGGNVVAQMDRSYLNRSWNKPKSPVQEAKLLDAKSRNNMYFIEYTVKKPSQEEKHLLSAIALGFNGRYNRLYTVTGQCRESELKDYKSTLQSVLQSFSPPQLPPY
ncbi:hypothetical protein ABBQ32_000813 [Trebouxia sp. C0010 RCD-2024]